ncbi:29952_t:CDS:2 [Gigaspora margarita]|uniref:29952_t:CDS:1 n=1 Tax=Gigaspora margarita TaxID=4874 RepID=A0ABN7ULW0_GIGMA|nr:29952_t:CDS:2 [Gigaspora margarita]
MDFQPTIISENNNEMDNLEETYDDSDTISDIDDLQEMNNDADNWLEINNNYSLLDVVPLNTTISLKQASFKQRSSRSSRQIDEFGDNSKMKLSYIKW